ncbi:MAG TPA: UvrD-helicase domain-containing protein [Planctomycetota bacterium]|nr:UvrD-helicase domain-containing protein [Planctomycetota bacterium]
MGILDDCTPPQIEAITHIDGPLLVVAGAGSGKTRVITRRVAYLVQRGVPPYRIIAITFTNKAAQEMRERVQQLAGTQGVWVSTFHSMCARMLRQFPDAIGYSRNFTVYDAADSLRTIKSCMKDLEISTDNWPANTMANAISGAKNELVDVDTYESRAGTFFEKTVARVYRRYQEVLHEREALDFDDLLFKVARLLSQETPFRGYWQERFRYVLIDEYQDTNHAQYLIARELAAQHRNICATGDPDQSIYGWRGADIRNILDFVQEYPDAKVVKLEENFRSTEFILKAADNVIVNNAERIPRALFTRQEGGSRIRLIACPDEEAEGEAVAGQVRALHHAGMPYGDMAIFYRTNFQSRTLENVFRLLGIPYTIVGTVEFYNRKEIKDILSYLRLLVNGRDDLAVQRIINVPPRGIGGQTVSVLDAWAREQKVPLMEAVCHAAEIPDLPDRAARAVDKFRALMEQLSQTKGPVSKIVDQAIKRSGYLDWVRGSKDEAKVDREENLGELVTAAGRYDERTPDSNLQDWLEEVALVSQIDEFQDDDDRVVMMTVHAAKGLEFPAVFITGVEEGLFPHEISMQSENGVEEERRLCYVAITRAKRELFITYAVSRMRFGLILEAQPSRFLREIPEDVMERMPIFGRVEEREEEEQARPAIIRKAEKPREAAPVAEYEPEQEYHVGEQVRHPTFGLGEVREISGSDARQTLLVRFKGVGIKRLVREYAKLEKV